MPFEGVPQTEKVPSTSRVSAMRRPAAEVQHPKTFEELAVESAKRNQRVVAKNVSREQKTGEEWNGEVETEREISPFQEIEEETRQKDIELTSQIRERFERAGYDRSAALGLTSQELQRLKKEKEAKEQAEFDAHELAKAADKLQNEKIGKEQELADRQAKMAQILARQAEGKRLMPPFGSDDQQAA